MFTQTDFLVLKMAYPAPAGPQMSKAIGPSIVMKQPSKTPMIRQNTWSSLSSSSSSRIPSSPRRRCPRSVAQRPAALCRGRLTQKRPGFNRFCENWQNWFEIESGRTEREQIDTDVRRGTKQIASQYNVVLIPVSVYCCPNTCVTVYCCPNICVSILLS